MGYLRSRSLGRANGGEYLDERLWRAPFELPAPVTSSPHISRDTVNKSLREWTDSIYFNGEIRRNEAKHLGGGQVLPQIIDDLTSAIVQNVIIFGHF